MLLLTIISLLLALVSAYQVSDCTPTSTPATLINYITTIAYCTCADTWMVGMDTFTLDRVETSTCQTTPLVPTVTTTDGDTTMTVSLSAITTVTTSTAVV